MNKITVITECTEAADTFQLEYSGVLIGPTHALYVDPAYNLAVLERVREENGKYITTGGPGSVILEIEVADTSFIDRITEMSAAELLTQFINRGNVK